MVLPGPWLRHATSNANYANTKEGNKMMRPFTVTLVMIAALVWVAVATGMRGQFSSAKIVQHGTALQVADPASFESDELSAVVRASVTQDGCTASGDSEFTSGSSWEARLTGCTFPRRRGVRPR